MHEVRVTRITEHLGATPDGRAKPMLRVEYMVGTHGPFIQVFDRAGFDPAAARRQLDEFARKLYELAPGEPSP